MFDLKPTFRQSFTLETAKFDLKTKFLTFSP